MAYNTCSRFPPPPVPYNFFEPGTYQFESVHKIKPRKTPFLSNAPRKTQACNRLWTHAMYTVNLHRHIPNITAMISKRPRFPYEALSAQDIEEMLCRCGLQNICECTDETEPEPELICQGKVRKRIFKGFSPRSVIAEGLSSPSKGDGGFELHANGTYKRLFTKQKDRSPPFYNTRVSESTAFYQGCKWSRWTSSRTTRTQEQRPGPADYCFERRSTYAEICSEKVRAHKRKTSKQLRFIEMVQQRNILEGRPGPATYSPQIPVSTNLKYLGPKTPRFQKSSEQHPGPADYCVPRDFESPSPPKIPCHAILPEPSFFGVKALRFKPRHEEGASPATYSPNIPKCNFMHCPTTGFGSSAVRFKDTQIEEEDEIIGIVAENEPQKDENEKSKEPCPTPTWGFKSKTNRLKPLIMRPNEQSPADIPQANLKAERSAELQYIAPFYTSEGRFEPWHDWMSVLGNLQTPGPGYYNFEKPRCIPAVCRGPLIRAQRFPAVISGSPGPGEYKVGGGVETILETHNEKLKNNIQNQHKFQWTPPVEIKKLTFEERETLLLNKSIALLEVDEAIDDNLSKAPQTPVAKETNKPKLLRYFLYNHPMK